MTLIEQLYRDWSIATNPLSIEIQTHLYGDWNNPDQPLHKFQEKRRRKRG
jgi:hypothetical protein